MQDKMDTCMETVLFCQKIVTYRAFNYLNIIGTIRSILYKIGWHLNIFVILNVYTNRNYFEGYIFKSFLTNWKRNKFEKRCFITFDIFAFTVYFSIRSNQFSKHFIRAKADIDKHEWMEKPLWKITRPQRKRGFQSYHIYIYIWEKHFRELS